MFSTSVKVKTTSHSQAVDITREVAEAVGASRVEAGICTVFVPHTTAGIVVGENSSPAIMGDLLATLERLVPWEGNYRHLEGNAAAHIKSVLTGSSVVLPVEEGRLSLRTWQSVFFLEFDGPRHRRVRVDICPLEPLSPRLEGAEGRQLELWSWPGAAQKELEAYPVDLSPKRGVGEGHTSLWDVTGDIQQVVSKLEVPQGLAAAFVPHTTAAVISGEVRPEPVRGIERLVPWEGEYTHVEPNIAASLKSLLTGSSLLMAVAGPKLITRRKKILFAEFDGPDLRGLNILPRLWKFPDPSLGVKVVGPERVELQGWDKDISSFVAQRVGESGVESGMCMVWVVNPSMGLCINEGAEPAVMEDVEQGLEQLAEEAGAQIGPWLVGGGVYLPVEGGQVVMGTWQSVFLLNFEKDSEAQAEVVVGVWGKQREGAR